MANINFNDYKKNQAEEEVVTEKISVGISDTTDTQIFVGYKDKKLVFDCIEYDLEEMESVIEVWMSYLMGEFKMRVDIMPKENFDKIKDDKELLGDRLGDYIMDNLHCLDCRTHFFETMCEDEEA